jgi:hypothetical protein
MVCGRRLPGSGVNLYIRRVFRMTGCSPLGDARRTPACPQRRRMADGYPCATDRHEAMLLADRPMTLPASCPSIFARPGVSPAGFSTTRPYSARLEARSLIHAVFASAAKQSLGECVLGSRLLRLARNDSRGRSRATASADRTGGRRPVGLRPAPAPVPAGRTPAWHADSGDETGSLMAGSAGLAPRPAG